MNIQNTLDKTSAVRAVMQLYIDGAAGDIEKLKLAFHPDACMFGHVENTRRDMPIKQFITGVENAPKPLIGPAYRADITAITVTGNAAVATLVEQDYRGCDFVNFFTLSCIGGKWQIVSKTYTSTGGPFR